MGGYIVFLRCRTWRQWLCSLAVSAVVAAPAVAEPAAALTVPDAFEPQVLALYEAYEAQLARVRAGGWTQVPDGRTLRPGDSAQAVVALRHRLAASGDAAAVLEPVTMAALHYDADLAVAVAAFQRRHGLKPDSVVGPATFAALNVSAAVRLRQLALNLERWQQIPVTDAPSMILVNVPEFRARLYREGREVLSMRAVVGAKSSPTPDLTETLERIVLNPNWFVPAGIGRRELLPKVVADPSYLARNNFRAYVGSSPIPASAFADPGLLPDASTVRFRQSPGPGNALGRVKFVLPNDRGIYLHDTSSRALFEHSTRAFSHGCVRLEQPLALVRTLLENEAGWSAERASKQIDSDKTIYLELAAELPVYVQYLTAKVVDGQVHFFDDVYDRDAERLAANSFDHSWVTLLSALRKHQRDSRSQDLLASTNDSTLGSDAAL